MKIYIACRYSRREEAKKFRERLELAGHEVTSRWLDTEWEVKLEHDGTSSIAPPEKREEFALIDAKDVQDSELVLSLTENPVTKNNGRGGRHVEFGMAVAWDKICVIIGPEEHIFHHLPIVHKYSNFDDFYRDLKFSQYKFHEV